MVWADSEFTELRLEHGGIVITGIEHRGDGTPIVLLHAHLRRAARA
jgi:hypothetical protein